MKWADEIILNNYFKGSREPLHATGKTHTVKLLGFLAAVPENGIAEEQKCTKRKKDGKKDGFAVVK